MKPKEIRELQTKEIVQRIVDEQKDLQHLEFRHAIAQLENPMILRTKRREIARLKTILHEREAAENA
jgi:large subunit ribosomal protein L29